jgi:hypothetical protein
MLNNFRKFYNSVDRFFDRRAISEKIQFSRDIPGEDRPKTAGQALAVTQPVASEFDRRAQLKLIASQQGVGADGTSVHWEFFFDLPDRRAQLAAEWKLTWNETADRHGKAQIVITVNPFPPADSPVRRMAQEGQLLHKQMVGMWEQELRRRPTLPHRFRDTDLVMSDFSKQGLDPSQSEFSLCTGQSSEGRPCWIAQTRDKSYFAAFA